MTIPVPCCDDPLCPFCGGTGKTTEDSRMVLHAARTADVPWLLGLSDDGWPMVFRDVPKSRNWHKITADGCDCGAWLNRGECPHMTMVMARFGSVQNLRAAIQEEEGR